MLKDIVEIGAKVTNRSLTISEFAAGVGSKSRSEGYWYQLIGNSGKVTEAHILKFKQYFRDELKAVGVPIPGEEISANQSLTLAIFDDYCERMAAIERVDREEIRVRVLNKATRFSDGAASDDLLKKDN